MTLRDREGSDCHNSGWGCGCYCHLVVEARDADKHPTRQRTAPLLSWIKNCPSSMSTVVEKIWYMKIYFFLFLFFLFHPFFLLNCNSRMTNGAYFMTRKRENATDFFLQTRYLVHTASVLTKVTRQFPPNFYLTNGITDFVPDCIG